MLHVELFKYICIFRKSETAELPILEYVGIRSKCYFIRTASSNKVALKGVGKRFRSALTLDKFRSALKSVRSFDVNTYALRSKAHSVHLVRQRKIAFSSFDCKNFLTVGEDTKRTTFFSE